MPSKAAERRQQVLEHLRSFPGTWISAPGIARALGYTRSNYHAIRLTCQGLLEEGLVECQSVQGGDGGTIWRVSSLTERK